MRKHGTQVARRPSFVKGDRILFQQTTPSAGWTKETTAAYDDSSPRIVTGSASNGGSVAFSTLFARTATDGYTLQVADIPAHVHRQSYVSDSGSGTTQSQSVNTANTASIATNNTDTQSTGGGGSHAHDIDMQVRYYDCCIGIKA